MTAPNKLSDRQRGVLAMLAEGCILYRTRNGRREWWVRNAVGTAHVHTAVAAALVARGYIRLKETGYPAEIWEISDAARAILAQAGKE